MPMLRLAAILLIYLLTPSALARTVEFHVESLDEPTSAAGVWRFHEGDDMAWVDPAMDHSRWGHILSPRDWRRQGFGDFTGIGWYRAVIQFDMSNPAMEGDLHQVAVGMGKIHSAYELYVSGEYIGGVGSLPPSPRIMHDRLRIYPIPRHLIDDDGKMLLAVRVWRDSTLGRSSTAGMYEVPVRIGTAVDLTRTMFIPEVRTLMLVIMYLVFGVYHLYLFARNRRSTEFFWFGLSSFLVSIYCLEVSQWRHLFPIISYEAHKKVEYSILYLFAATGIQMVWSLLQYKPSRYQRWYQLTHVALAALILIVPGQAILVYSLFPWQMLAILGLMGVMVHVLWESLHGNKEARTMLPGWAIFLGIGLNDILVAQGVLQNERWLSLGFAAVMISMLLSLANRYSRMYNHLETEVRERTRELQETNEKLVETARLDALTGLLNRRGFAQKLEAEIARVMRTRRNFVLIMADIDHFKLFNDQHGHACGDYVLREIAALLRNQLRDVDIMARWGGEEFTFLLPETSLEGGAVLAEKLRSAVEQHQFNYRDNIILNLTITMGVAQYYQGMSIDDCLARADQALYEGKEAGRNRVVVKVTAPPKGTFRSLAAREEAEAAEAEAQENAQN